ncbi:VWA domain-containing protein [Haloarcula sp. CBA1128]|uniref:VWA domain-containing protein n=1 Tax=Haloarcula sp. CBA1128 TaxID=1765056 RepID=UPI0009AD3606|nr:VWA domain-containing protein [Haloarcula sp. CBA1128]
MASSTTKLQALFGVLLLVTVGPVSGMMTGTGAGPLQTAGNDISGTSAGNQAVTTAGNEPTRTQPTQTPASTAGNQATGPLSTSWNGSTEPNASAIAELAPRENDSHPYPLVGDNQPTDPDGDGLYEDVNGDGAVNIVDVDALSRHLGSTAAGANWSAYDYTGDNRTDVGDIQWLFVATRSTPSNDTDGDGLPDAYERNVTKTDPKVADSDGDAVIDGAEDWDNDTLPAYREYRLGTDPRSNDTDGDGLTDDVESRLQGVDPTDPDTNDDGVQDGAADPDNDSLSIYNETVAGTLTNNPDTDGDGLLDGTEVHQLGTDPLKADTDNDGLPDGEEVRLGTDPLVADSNDNGVSDGEESYTTTAANETLGVTLSLTGNGDIGNGTTIAPQDDPRFNTSRVGNMSASPVVKLNSEQEFSSANVTLAYNETGVENESQDLAVFTYDPEAGIFVPLNSTVDATNNTATAETTHFSTFAVFDISNWATTYNATEPVRQTDDDGLRPVDVTLVMDTSGSMSSSVKLRNTAGQRFVAGLLDVDRVAVVDFDSSAYVAQDLTSDFGAANSTLDNLGSGGGTDIGSGLSTANSQFASNSNDSRAQVMILLTDGRGNGGISEAQTAANQNTTVYTVGFDNANRDKLRDIANITGGEFNYVTDRSELPNVFSRIAENTTEINDTDGDGLSDEMEREGVILGGPNGDRVTTDPKSADTDGDGLSDSREIGQYTEVSYRGRTASYYNHLANPRQVDTDGDNLTDAEEVAGWEVQRTQSANASKGYLNVSRPDPSKRLLRSYLRSLYRGETESYQPQISRGPDSSSSKALAITIAEQTDIDVSTLNETGHGPSPNGSYLTNITATSDPLQPDTDHDGLADNVEHLRETDPSRADTDGDGISDQTEFTSGTAPVLFDHRAPTVTIESIRTKRIKNTTKVIVRQQGTTKTVRPENIKTTDSTSSGAILVAKYRYTVRLRAHDPSGVSKLVVKPDCQYLARRAGSNLGSFMESACQGDGETIRFDNETTTSYRRVEFTVRTPIDKAGVFAFQEFSQFFESSPVAVTAVDSNRNSRSSDYTSPGAIPELAKTAADHPATGERTEDRVIEEIAYRSGGVWGVRQSALDLSYFLSHPWTAVTWLGNIDRLPDAALRAPETLPSAARNLQDRQNPFDRRTETENYKLYGQNWLVGYGSGVAGSELSIGLATGGGSTVSKAAKLRKVTDTVGDAGTAARGWTFHRSVRMASTISEGTDIKPAGTRRALGRVAIPERVRHAQRLNSPRWTRLIESLPERATGPSRTERVSRTMRRTGDDGRQLMLQLHNSGDQRALETFIAMDETPGTQRALVRASREDPDVSKQDLSEALRRYDELDANERSEFDRFVEASGDNGIKFASDLDTDQAREFFSSACRRSPSIGAAPRPRSDRFYSIKTIGGSSLAGCGDDLTDAEETRYYSRIADVAAENEDISAGEIFEQVSDVDDATRREAVKRLLADSGEDGVRLTRNIDSDAQEIFFDLGRNDRIDGFDDFDEWRSAIANAEDVDAAEAGRYAERVDSAATRDNIDDVHEILDETTPRTDAVAGESGEAASAIRYADDGAEVEMEPGQTDAYDMSVEEGGTTEYVEVKTRADNDVDYNYINTQISEMNKKHNNALDDPELDVSENAQVLEIRTRAPSDELSSAQTAAENVLDDRVDAQVDEIRLVAENGDTVTVEP